MAHLFSTGFFVRAAAWHQLGTVIEEAPSTLEAHRISGLDWEVLKLQQMY